MSTSTRSPQRETTAVPQCGVLSTGFEHRTQSLDVGRVRREERRADAVGIHCGDLCVQRPTASY